jgi:protein-disulfide isomerase
MRISKPAALASAIIALLAACCVHGGAQASGQKGVDSAPSSPVSLVVFSDFQCQYSSQMFFTLERLQARYPGQLRVTYKESPLPIHPAAQLAHRAALAAGKQGHYEAMAELLYANQNPQTESSLVAFARQLHLDTVRFRRDLNSSSVAAELNADMEESRAFAIEQTPSLFLNGKLLIGYQPEEILAGFIDKAAAAKTAVAAASSDSKALDPALLAEIEKSPTAARGAGDAPLTVVEFTDFQCPYCRAAAAPMEQFMTAHSHDVRWIIRTFPLDFHTDSELATEAALAAGEQGKFWEMHDLLFANQSALKKDNLRSYAEKLHLDMRAFDDALATHRFAGQIAADRALGEKAGVAGTPTFYVNGRQMVGALSIPQLTQVAAVHATRKAGDPVEVAAAVPLLGPEVPDQLVIGSGAQAPVTLTWFVDVRSPLVQQQAELLHQLASQYKDQIRVLFRAFPLGSHEDSEICSVALVAALKQDNFWPMFNAIAERHDVLDRGKLVAIADSAGLNHDRFLADLETAAASVKSNVSEATQRGILGAPVLFLNKQRVDGLQRKQFYTNILDQELGVSRATQASLTQ